MSFAWFPAGEWTEARRRWTDLQEQELPEDHAAYSKVIESRIRGLSRDFGRNLMIAPMTVDALEGYSRHRGLDPNTAEARAQFAAELTRLGQTLDWPPRRNEPCWCGSGLKYKGCCATAPDDRVRNRPV
jgi:SEC-C motif